MVKYSILYYFTVTTYSAWVILQLSTSLPTFAREGGPPALPKPNGRLIRRPHGEERRLSLRGNGCADNTSSTWLVPLD